jgi:hypothetical protein
VGDRVVVGSSMAQARQFAKRGVPAACRGPIWQAALGAELTDAVRPSCKVAAR